MTNPKIPPLIVHGWDRMTVFQRNALEREHRRRHRSFAQLALDRGSRTFDADGRMHVVATPVTREQVAPYNASEIPGAAALGLDMGRAYNVYRPAAELAKAAATFRNLPLLSQHVHVTADDHRPDLVVGSTGTDAAWDVPYLRVSLTIWAADAIAAVKDGSQRELSAAYRYTARRDPGVFEGTPYELSMSNIRGQHVALVDRGRAGPDVLVADAMPGFRRRGALAADAALTPREFNILRQAVAGNPKKERTMATDTEMTTKLMDYLSTCLTPEQMADVKAILAGGDVDNEEMAMAADSRIRQRVAQATVRGMATAEKSFYERFPNARRLARGI